MTTGAGYSFWNDALLDAERRAAGLDFVERGYRDRLSTQIKRPPRRRPPCSPTGLLKGDQATRNDGPFVFRR